MFMIYGWFMTLLSPLGWIIGRMRLRKGKEKESFFPQRFGRIALARPQGKIFWFHGASLGEAQSALNIIRVLLDKNPEMSILLTVQSRSALDGLEGHLPAQVILQVVPYDHPPFITRFLDHWKPESLCVFEAEFWPGIWSLSHKRGVRLSVLNFHMSQKSHRVWSCWGMRGVFRRAYGWAEFVMTSCAQSKDFFTSLVQRPIVQIPSLKYQARPQDAQDVRKASEFKPDRPFVLISCIHEQEEAFFLELLGQLRQTFPDLLLVCAPRHAARFEPFAEKLRILGPIVSWSARPCLASAKILVVDALGQLDGFYRAASFVVLAGSFVKGLKGHSLIEPAFHGCACLHGPHMDHQRSIVEDFAPHFAHHPSTQETLLKDVTFFLNNPDYVSILGHKALQVACTQRTKLEESLRPFYSHWT